MGCRRLAATLVLGPRMLANESEGPAVDPLARQLKFDLTRESCSFVSPSSQWHALHLFLRDTGRHSQ
jgi:hypothetical protein